jgi:tetratricopeptide (TPR) repeat protein
MYTHHLTEFLREPEETDEPERLLVESLAFYRAHTEWDPREYRHAASLLSALYAKLGRKSAAIEALEESLVPERRFAKPNSMDLLVALERVGYGLYRLDEFARCEPYLPRADGGSAARCIPKGHIRTGMYLRELANIRVKAGRIADAEVPLLECLELSRKVPNWYPRELAEALHLLGDVYVKTDRKKSWHRRVLRQHGREAQDAAVESLELASALGAIASELSGLGAFARAEPLLRECVICAGACSPTGIRARVRSTRPRARSVK